MTASGVGSSVVYCMCHSSNDNGMFMYLKAYSTLYSMVVLSMLGWWCRRMF